MAELIYPEESYAIMGACFEVYKQKGPGFLEAVYQECLEIELRLRGIPFIRKPKLMLEYKGHALESWYEPDMLCYQKIVVELKALRALCDEHRACTHNYLKSTGHRLALLVNFGHYPQLEWERIVR